VKKFGRTFASEIASENEKNGFGSFGKYVLSALPAAPPFPLPREVAWRRRN